MILKTALAHLALSVALGHPEAENEYTGPGWYRLTLESQSELTVKILDERDDAFNCLHQGTTLSVSRADVVSIVPLGSGAEEGKKGLNPKQSVEVLDAIESLASRDHRVRTEAYDLIARRFPGARELVHEALGHRQRRVRALCAKILGENGEGQEDIEPLLGLLRDSQPTVRLNVILAIRRLGPDLGHVEDIASYTHWEPDKNIRKMAVKTLEWWKATEATESLILLMAREKEPDVRVFIRRALRELTDVDMGESPQAWLSYLEQSQGDRFQDSLREDLEREEVRSD